MVPPLKDRSVRLKIDGLQWRRVDSLEGAGPEDPVYKIRTREDGTIALLFGDGRRGAGPPSGEVHIRATYRVGTTVLVTDARFRSETPFTGIRLQQGRVILDHDWNEAHGASQYYCGIYRGVVVSNQDPLGIMRLQVRVPEVYGLLDAWALPCIPYGSTALPPKDEMVWILFEHGDAAYPVWMGTAPTG